MPGLFNEILGKEIPIPDSPLRIVSLSPAITETLFSLGLGEKIIGVSAFCARPAEARQKRKVGSYSTTNIDLLREVKPDLILTTTGYQRDLTLRLAQEFPVYPLSLPVSISGIIDTVVKVGLVVNEQDKARTLASNLTRRLSRIAPAVGHPRVYVEIDLGGPISFGAHSYITDSMHFLGASTLYDHARTEWLTPNLNDVESADPDAIFYEAKMYSKFDQGDLERLINDRRWNKLRAVRNGKCFLTPGPLDFLAHHGPSYVEEAIPWVSEKLASG